MDTETFLKQVVTTDEGWFQLLVGPPTGEGWHEEWFEWPSGLQDILARANAAAVQDNVYFTAHLFDQRSSTKAHVLPTRTIQADLDEAPIPVVNSPTVLVETSPGRHQGYWLLRDEHDPITLEGLSKQLTYSIPDADRSGWSLGHKMRLPGTVNYKYASGPKPVKIVSAALTVYKQLQLNGATLPAIDTQADWSPEPLDGGVRELWVSIRNKVPRRVLAQYDNKQPDRSGALWALMLALFRAGCDRNQVFWLSRESVNNKFKDNKYHADLDLAKDVLRAERSLAQGGSDDDIRTRILEARRLPGLVAERRAYIAALVRDSMAQQGSFVATLGGEEYFVREDTGRPLPLTRSNDYLNALLEIRYGLNASEGEQRYVINSLISTTKERGKPGVVASLSYYDSAQQVLLVHTGRKDVLLVDHNSVSHINNGDMNVVFPWQPQAEPFDIDLNSDLSLDSLFEDCFDNLNELKPEHAMALVKAWLVFLLFRDDAISKPILALFGQPGSGKSTLFRRIYALLYGGQKAINSITSADDFDHAVATDPLVVFDNVDTWVSWLPDKLALSAASSDLVKRKLYTDSDIVVLKRQALVGITAHNPKFRREDIVDRLVMLTFHRLAEFQPEGDILKHVLTRRDQLWGALLKAAQATLATPQPASTDVPRFRVSDFARIGLRIARGNGFENDFIAALQANAVEQQAFNLEEEDLLVDTIRIWLQRQPSNKFYSIGELWTQWSNLSRDPQGFAKSYKGPVALGKKLWSLQDTLNSVLHVDYKYDEATNTRLWRIT